MRRNFQHFQQTSRILLVIPDIENPNRLVNNSIHHRHLNLIDHIVPECLKTPLRLNRRRLYRPQSFQYVHE